MGWWVTAAYVVLYSDTFLVTLNQGQVINEMAPSSQPTTTTLLYSSLLSIWWRWWWYNLHRRSFKKVHQHFIHMFSRTFHLPKAIIIPVVNTFIHTNVLFISAICSKKDNHHLSKIFPFSHHPPPSILSVAFDFYLIYSLLIFLFSLSKPIILTHTPSKECKWMYHINGEKKSDISEKKFTHWRNAEHQYQPRQWERNAEKNARKVERQQGIVNIILIIFIYYDKLEINSASSITSFEKNTSKREWDIKKYFFQWI